MFGLYRFPWGISASVSYFYGSGNRFTAAIATAVYGKPGTNRLNLTAAGGPTNAIVIPATATLANGDVIDIASRFHGPSTINSGDTIPRNALQGLPLHKVDLRLTKDITLVGSVKLSLIGEVYNLFNHHNYGSYNRQSERDRARRPRRCSGSRSRTRATPTCRGRRSSPSGSGSNEVGWGGWGR